MDVHTGAIVTKQASTFKLPESSMFATMVSKIRERAGGRQDCAEDDAGWLCRGELGVEDVVVGKGGSNWSRPAS